MSRWNGRQPRSLYTLERSGRPTFATNMSGFRDPHLYTRDTLTKLHDSVGYTKMAAGTKFGGKNE